MDEQVTIRIPEETLEQWKWSCVQLLTAAEPELLLEIMRKLEKRSTMELPPEETISMTLEHLLSEVIQSPLSGRDTE